MIRLEGSALPEESRGRVVPVLFGDHKDVPAIAIRVGYQATLATNCGIEVLTNVTVEISGPNLDIIRSRVPSVGVIQIDSEWMIYSAFLTNPYRLVISTRGLGSTDAATHSKGASVLFVESKPLYAFAWCPPGHTYGGVTQVRINDSTQVPFHTIRLQDDRIVPGHRMVTVEFDLTRSLGSVPTGASMVSIAGGGPLDGESDPNPTPPWRDPITRAARRKRKRLMRQGRLPVLRSEYAPIAGGSGVVGFTGLAASVQKSASAAYGGGLQKVKGVMLAPPPPRPTPMTPPAPTLASAQGSTVSPNLTPVRLLQLPLGSVTIDMNGLLDDSSGRLTGTPNLPLVSPAPITRLILEDTFRETRLAKAVWDATHARQLAVGLTWRLRWSGEDFESFRSMAGYCGQADLFVDDMGDWQYKFRERQAPTVATITERELVGELSLGWTDLSDLATRLNVTWGDTTLVGGTFVLDSPLKARYDVRAMDLQLPWMATEAGARLVARYWLSQRDHPRQLASFSVAPALAALTRTDRVKLSTELVDLYTAGTVPFQIRATTDRGAERVLSLIESDPQALEILAHGTLGRVAVVGLPAYGTVTITGDVPRLWRAMIPGDMLVW